MSAAHPQFEAQYFRSYGIHSVENGNSMDHLASFGSWKDLESALKNNLPETGRIITPEYATIDTSSQFSLEDSVEQIEDRIAFIKDLSQQTDATIFLGTARKIHDTTDPMRVPTDRWHNVTLEIQDGNIKDTHYKFKPLEVEADKGIEKPPRSKKRIVKDGMAVLICADLYEAQYDNDLLFKLTAREVLAPMAFAHPLNGEAQPAEKRDRYYQDGLEMIVGSCVLDKLPMVNRVTAVDKGRPDIAPYNAVFTRIE